MSDDELKVCGKCGWHDLKYAGHPCDPAAGKAAAELQDQVLARVPGVGFTQLGYGNGRATLEIDDDFVVGFDVDGSDATFRWRYLHCLGALTTTDAADLIDMLAAWRKRCKEKK